MMYIGDLLELRSNVNAGSMMKLGGLYKKGSYFVRIIQGKEHKEIKLIKMSE